MKIWIVFEGYKEGDYLDGSIIRVISSEKFLQQYKQDNDDTSNLHFIEWNIITGE